MSYAAAGGQVQSDDFSEMGSRDDVLSPSNIELLELSRQIKAKTEKFRSELAEVT